MWNVAQMAKKPTVPWFDVNLAVAEYAMTSTLGPVPNVGTYLKMRLRIEPIREYHQPLFLARGRSASREVRRSEINNPLVQRRNDWSREPASRSTNGVAIHAVDEGIP